MVEANETMADIVAEIRQWADQSVHNVGRDVLRRDAQHFADRIGAAAATTEKSSAVGNAAAMRESLVAIRKALLLDSGMGPCTEFHAEVDRLTATALSTPARNCDVFGSEAERRDAFIAWYNETFDLKGSDAIDTCDLKHDVDGILHDYIYWLLAPAAERKGEVDGNG